MSFHLLIEIIEKCINFQFTIFFIILFYAMDSKFRYSFSTTHLDSHLQTSQTLSTDKRKLPRQSLNNPFPEPKLLKFPKHPIRRQSSTNILYQTQQNRRPPSIKIFPKYYQSLNPESPSTRRLRNPGIFHSHSFQSLAVIVENRSFEDIGVQGGKKGQKYRNPIKADPIMEGQKRVETKPQYQRVWKEKRKMRDYGDRMKNKFVWNTSKNNSYLQKYRAAKAKQ